MARWELSAGSHRSRGRARHLGRQPVRRPCRDRRGAGARQVGVDGTRPPTISGVMHPATVPFHAASTTTRRKAEAAEPLPPRESAQRRRRPCSALSARHDHAAVAPCRAGARRRAPRPDELGEDVRSAAGAGGEALRCLCGTAAHARAGGAPPARRVDRGRARRARHGRGAGQRARAGDLLDRRDGAALGELLVLDEVQWADDTERGSAWTRLLLAGEYREILLLGALDALPLVDRAFPEARAQGLRAQAAARVRRRADAALADDGNGRRRVQPARRARARR